MNNYNFIIAPTDTDSISFCKQDMTPFPKDEVKKLVQEINDISPEMMVWEDDGYYKTVIVVRAKNYVLEKEDGSITYKGNSVKAPMKEIALQEFIKEIIAEILRGEENFTDIYHKYVKEIKNLSDIKRWTSKKTITPSVLNPKRTNEQKIKDILEDTNYVEGDKIRVFFKEDGNLCLEEKFSGDFCRDTLLKKLYNTAEIFKFVLVTEELFLNYSLKRNRGALEQL